MIKYVGISSLIVYILLVFILIINEEKKSKIIKYAFIFLFFLLSMSFLYFNQTIIDQVLRSVIEYIYFPNFVAYLITIFLTLCIFLYSVFNEQMHRKIKIINYIFSGILIVSYIVFMMLNVDVSSYNALYDSTSLICLRCGTRIFLGWMVSILILKYYKCFLKKR